MYGGTLLSKDLNLPLQQQAVAGVRTPPQMSSPGLLRYRSAPSTLLGDVCGDFLPATGAGAGHSPGSPDHHAADAAFTRFLAAPPRPAAAPANNHFSTDTAASLASSQQQHQQQLMYQSQQQLAAMEGLFRTGGTDPAAGNNGLVRQSSSPAGFLNHLNMDNGGYGNMLRAGMGGGGGGGGGGYGNGDARLRGQLSFSSRQGSVMSQISEMASEELGGGSDGEEAGSNGAAARGYGGIPGYPMGGGGGGGWDDPSPSPSLSPGAMKRPRDVPAAAKNGTSRQQLKQQYSLPASSKPTPEMAAIEKFLQFQDAVPCKIRAKRGCATHPRSIAERVRRTKISDRIRKLQELVPNMEKQTNTSDMLDLAVDYIKELQMQVKVMNDGRTSCTCAASRQKRFGS
ncbi:hypothetical protein QYE76_006129 [Lolium multiflorum]|uniref:BHLH domain-containing protein n=1 Tax=Lolium multiflorum TaxID=4521 RepID=A0AAD8RW82_LOLMU|nr:hypothetical protein QYE76_006129 [Lolium multiflorum]